MSTSEKTVAGQCFNCKKDVGEDMFCHGCKAFICDQCDKSIGLFGSHAKERHLVGDDESFDEDPDDE